jgi:hypothetical protein
MTVVGSLCEPGSVEVTARHIEQVPRGNLRVPLRDFAAVWALAERRGDDLKQAQASDWYVTGVAMTCRWLAAAMVPSIMGGSEPASAPISRRRATAHEELIEAETLAAGLACERHPDGMSRRPGWLEGISSTLHWAWRGNGIPPLDTHAER